MYTVECTAEFIVLLVVMNFLEIVLFYLLVFSSVIHTAKNGGNELTAFVRLQPKRYLGHSVF